MPNGRPYSAEYSAYTAAHGPLSYDSWMKAGRPKPRGGTPAPTPPTPSTPGPPEAPPWYEGLGEKVKGILPKLPWEALPPPWGAVAGLARPTMEAGLEGQWPWQQPAEAAAPMEFGPGFYEALGRMPTGIREQFPGAPPPTIPQQAAAVREAEEALTGIGGGLEAPEFPTAPPPEGYRWEYDSASMRYVLEPLPGAVPPAEMSDWQREQIRLAEEEAASEQAWRQQQQDWQRQQQQWQEQQWQQQYGLQQEQQQWQQQQAEAQERARLMASPQSWLQYHAYTGETPQVQPWMKPLMSEQYGIGQAIPGWSAEGGQAMPQLTQPSRQYQARMGPTAMGQYLGYRQARTGVRPQEEQWRLWSQAPPSGRGGGLQWTR